MEHRDRQILNELRRNSRASLREIAQATGISAATVFSRLRALEKNCIIKYTTVPDFEKLGYCMRSFMVVKAKEKKKLLSFLAENPNANTVHELSGNADYSFEAIFPDLSAMHRMLDELSPLCKRIDEHWIVEEIKREGMQL